MTSSSEKKRRLPSLRRVKDEELPSFRLTQRDREVIQAVYEYRAMTTDQLGKLFFPSEQTEVTSRCLHRLKLLFHHRFLFRAEQPQLISEGRKPFVYYLDQRGAKLLADLHHCDVKGLDWSPRSYPVGHLFLDHLLATNDVRLAIAISAQKHSYTVETWFDEKTLKSNQMKDTVTITSPRGASQSASVVPDGYFLLLAEGHYYHQFLETDRQTVTGNSRKWGKRTWARKVQAYVEYYRSGKYHARYHTKSMRVLTVTTGKRRLENLKLVTEESGGKARFWFTTFEQVQSSDVLVDPIWQVAGKEGLRTLVW